MKKKAILTSTKIIKILGDKGYPAKIRYDKTIIVIDKTTGGNYFFSSEKLKELIKLIMNV